MSDAVGLTDAELVDELKRRCLVPSCPCGKWQTYIGTYDRDGYTVRCSGCLRAIAKCWC